LLVPSPRMENEVANLGLLQTPALAEKQDRLGLDRGDQIHHRRSHSTPHAKVEDRQVLSGRRLHGMSPTHDIDAESIGKQFDVTDKIAEQDEPTEFCKWASGVTRQPVPDNLRFCIHGDDIRWKKWTATSILGKQRKSLIRSIPGVALEMVERYVIGGDNQA
jgi:hypothetical protein